MVFATSCLNCHSILCNTTNIGDSPTPTPPAPKASREGLFGADIIILMGGAGAQHPERLEPGRKIGAYVLVRELGRGGMGVVWLAKDDRLGRLVAIKTLHVGGASDGDTERRRIRERALSEARALAAIEHTNIASVFDIVEAESTVFVVMEYVPGEALSERIRRGVMRAKEAIGIAAQVAVALAAAHSKGLLHRDLKPSNIQITHDGVAKVLDFGLSATSDRVRRDAAPGVARGAAETAEWATEHGGGAKDESGVAIRSVVSGTPAYMSPEQLAGEELDARSDMYAFGCVLYEMLTGRTAQRVLSAGGGGRISVEPVWDMARIEPQPGGPPESVRTLLAGCLHPERRERVRSAADAGVILNRVLEDSRSGVQRVVPGSVWRKAVRSRGGVFVLASVVAMALAWIVVMPYVVAPMEWAHSWYARNAKMPPAGDQKKAMENIAIIGMHGGEDAEKAAGILGVEGVSAERLKSFRRVHAAMVDRLAKAKPKCISFDIRFSAADDPEDSREFAAAIRRATGVGVSVVLAVMTWHRDEFGLPTNFDPQLLESGARRGVALADSDERTGLWAIELGLAREGLSQGNTDVCLESYVASLYPSGNTTLVIDGSNVWAEVWKTKGVGQVSERVLIAPRLRLRSTYVQEVTPEVMAKGKMSAEKGYQVGDRVADIFAPFDRSFASVDGVPSYEQLARLSDDELARRFGGRIVLIGDTSQDMHPAPDGGEQVWGPFAHLAGFSVLLSEAWVQEVSAPWFFVWALFACAVGVVCTFFTPRTWQGVVLAGTLSLVIVVSCLWMPRTMGVWLNPISLVAALWVGVGVGEIAMKRMAKMKGTLA